MYRTVGPDHWHLFDLRNGTTLHLVSPVAASYVMLTRPDRRALMIRNDGTDDAWLRFGTGPVAHGLGGVFRIAPGERQVIEAHEAALAPPIVSFGYLCGPLFLAWERLPDTNAGTAGNPGEEPQ